MSNSKLKGNHQNISRLPLKLVLNMSQPKFHERTMPSNYLSELNRISPEIKTVFAGIFTLAKLLDVVMTWLLISIDEIV